MKPKPSCMRAVKTADNTAHTGQDLRVSIVR